MTSHRSTGLLALAIACLGIGQGYVATQPSAVELGGRTQTDRAAAPSPRSTEDGGKTDLAKRSRDDGRERPPDVSGNPRALPPKLRLGVAVRPGCVEIGSVAVVVVQTEPEAAVSIVVSWPGLNTIAPYRVERAGSNGRVELTFRVDDAAEPGKGRVGVQAGSYGRGNDSVVHFDVASAGGCAR